MKKQIFLSAVILLLHYAETDAQLMPFSTIEYVDINNLRASVLLHGDLWSQPLNGPNPACEFPKGSGRHTMMGGALWMAGYGDNGKLHVSAQMYRGTGNDYWPGPLDNTGSTTAPIINQWAKIWKINQSDISKFLSLTNRDSINTPRVILEWPAKGNLHAKGNGGASIVVDRDMAPYVDANKDGKYNALDGDYPEMKGDQMLWWIFNDNGITHNFSTNGGVPFKAEIKACAYAFKKSTSADNIIFYEYQVANRSTTNYTDFRMGLWIDPDLGYAFDDFIGFDSSRRMGIVYNGRPEDGNGEPESYGSQVPTAAVTLLSMPGDNQNSKVPAGSFVYHNNGNGVLGDPATDSDYDNYMRALLKNGDPFRNDFVGKGVVSRGFGTGPATKYVFPGDPSDNKQWSECASNNQPYDRRFLITSNDFNFNAGATEKLVFALVVTDPIPAYSCNDGFNEIKKVADSAQQIHKSLQSVSVGRIHTASSQINAYPNPASSMLYIEGLNSAVANNAVRVYDNIGRLIATENIYKDGRLQIDISRLAPGMYYIQCRDGEIQHNSRFIKE
ncbi:MAG: T9SS type A sorting domain-containing protein [Sphingobacteriales bacterium]|nr:MAG: T9SS type A sorting domain-containing protein [Sphingobacteriales bacterium]